MVLFDGKRSKQSCESKTLSLAWSDALQFAVLNFNLDERLPFGKFHRVFRSNQFQLSIRELTICCEEMVVQKGDFPEHTLWPQLGLTVRKILTITTGLGTCLKSTNKVNAIQRQLTQSLEVKSLDSNPVLILFNGKPVLIPTLLSIFIKINLTM